MTIEAPTTYKPVSARRRIWFLEYPKGYLTKELELTKDPNLAKVFFNKKAIAVELTDLQEKNPHKADGMAGYTISGWTILSPLAATSDIRGMREVAISTRYFWCVMSARTYMSTGYEFTESFTRAVIFDKKEDAIPYEGGEGDNRRIAKQCICHIPQSKVQNIIRRKMTEEELADMEERNKPKYAWNGVLLVDEPFTFYDIRQQAREVKIGKEKLLDSTTA